MLVFVLRRLLAVAAVMVGVAALVFSVFYGLRPERVADGTGYFHQLSHFLVRVFFHLDPARRRSARSAFSRSSRCCGPRFPPTSRSWPAAS